MQWKDAEQLREIWGDKPCDHPDYDKEYYLGADTMDKVCTQCGQVLSSEEIEEIKRRKNQSCS
jgi:hypothetical protein